MTLARRFSPESSLHDVLADPQAAKILAAAGPLFATEEEHYDVGPHPIGLVVRTSPALAGNTATQDAVLRSILALGPEDLPLQEMPVRAPLRRTVRGRNVTVVAAGQVRMFERFEATIRGSFTGNAYTDHELAATVTLPTGQQVEVPGFADGDGVLRVRFLPTSIGRYSVLLHSDDSAVDGRRIDFESTPSRPEDHGPVTVDGFHFRYADGTPFRPIGTTAYAWIHQSESLQDRTLTTLHAAGFTKLRMCVFPKWFAFNETEPERAAFVRGADGRYDFDRPDPVFWSALEHRIEQLGELGIEVDVVLFHPYDHWGFSDMGADADDRYVRYVVARLAAFPNVWWSLANEYDVIFTKQLSDWERMAAIVVTADPVGHLLSIHHCIEFYDHGRPWITHASIQHPDVERTVEWREAWGKPVVIDECGYEGDLQYPWGNLSATEMVRRHWETAVRGGYAGHGETYGSPDGDIWWSTGGDLRGQSAERIAFLRTVMEQTPDSPWDPSGPRWVFPTAGVEGEFSITYLGLTQSASQFFLLDPDRSWSVDVIDTWNMTIDRVAEHVTGRVRVAVDGRQHLAVRITRESEPRGHLDRTSETHTTARRL